MVIFRKENIADQDFPIGIVDMRRKGESREEFLKRIGYPDNPSVFDVTKGNLNQDLEKIPFGIEE